MDLCVYLLKETKICALEHISYSEITHELRTLKRPRKYAVSRTLFNNSGFHVEFVSCFLRDV